jgi:peptidoglycan/LPS O-acetylase OafA/YrhL
VSGSTSRLREVDVLRGFAALAVVFSHYFPYWHESLAPLPLEVPRALGYYAVKLFFVISGFVILMTLDRCKTIADFAILRFSRLYPAYWASLIIVTLVQVVLLGNTFWPGGFLANGTMFQQFLGYPHFDLVFWSLSVELAFYLNVAWVFLLGLHRKLHGVVLAWLALAAIWVVVFHDPGLVTAHAVVDPANRDWLALLFAFDYAPYFVMGILFYRGTRHGWTWPTVTLMVCAIALELLLASFEGLAVAAVIATVFGLAVSGYLRFLVTKFTLWLGAISYSLYLIHWNLGHDSLRWMHAHGVEPFVAIGAAVLGALLLATALAYGVERPVSAWLRSRHPRAGRPSGPGEVSANAMTPGSNPPATPTQAVRPSGGA